MLNAILKIIFIFKADIIKNATKKMYASIENRMLKVHLQIDSSKDIFYNGDLYKVTIPYWMNPNFQKYFSIAILLKVRNTNMRRTFITVSMKNNNIFFGG